VTVAIIAAAPEVAVGAAVVAVVGLIANEIFKGDASGDKDPIAFVEPDESGGFYVSFDGTDIKYHCNDLNESTSCSRM
jgi:hypothetical protein